MNTKSTPTILVIFSLLFISAMLTLILGLLCFLREIFLATGSIETRAKKRHLF